jgi:hypothetical protein
MIRLCTVLQDLISGSGFATIYSVVEQNVAHMSIQNLLLCWSLKSFCIYIGVWEINLHLLWCFMLWTVSVPAVCITKTSVLQDGHFILEIIAVNNDFIILSLFKCWLCKDNTKMDIKETGWVGMGWIHLCQDRNMWQAVVKTVMNYKMWGVSRLDEELVAYQDLLCSMQLVNIIWLTSWFLSDCVWEQILCHPVIEALFWNPRLLWQGLFSILLLGMTPCSLVDRYQRFIGTCSVLTLTYNGHNRYFWYSGTCLPD